MTTSRRRTAETLSRTLEVKANQAITAHKAPANAQQSTPTEFTSPPNRRRRFLLPAAALVVVLAMIAATAIALQADSDDEPADTVTVANPPDGWLVPSWLPAGMEPWGLEWSAPTEPSDFGEPATIPQLFGDPDAGRAIYITSHQYSLASDAGKDIRVRGQAGQAGLSWNVEEAEMGPAIEWTERGAKITALYKGMSEDTAISVLDSLEWRSDDPADGLAQPADDSLPLRAEVPRERSSHDLTLTYSEGVPVGLAAGTGQGLQIHTSASTTAATWYLEGWYLKGADADGGERPIRRYDEESQHLEVYWPDGRSVTIWATGSALGQDSLERIADSLTVATEADLEGIRDSVETRVEALPVVASARTSLGILEVHGERDFLQMCLRRQSEPGPNCMVNSMFGGMSEDGTAIVAGEWTLDGTWYVVVASTGEHPQIIGGEDAGVSPDAGELPAETTADGEWMIRLVEPAPDIESVCTSSDEGGASCSHVRPE